MVSLVVTVLPGCESSSPVFQVGQPLRLTCVTGNPLLKCNQHSRTKLSLKAVLHHNSHLNSTDHHSKDGTPDPNASPGQLFFDQSQQVSCNAYDPPRTVDVSKMLSPLLDSLESHNLYNHTSNNSLTDGNLSTTT